MPEIPMLVFIHLFADKDRVTGYAVGEDYPGYMALMRQEVTESKVA